MSNGLPLQFAETEGSHSPASKMRLSETVFTRRARCASSGVFKEYDERSEIVPAYYCRPGPGAYNINQGMGKKTKVAAF